jgi:hypothetical protein
MHHTIDEDEKNVVSILLRCGPVRTRRGKRTDGKGECEEVWKVLRVFDSYKG